MGFWKGTEDVAANWAEDTRWEPTEDAETTAKYFRNWQKAVTKTFDWVDADVD